MCSKFSWSNRPWTAIFCCILISFFYSFQMRIKTIHINNFILFYLGNQRRSGWTYKVCNLVKLDCIRRFMEGCCIHPLTRATIDATRMPEGSSVDPASSLCRFAPSKSATAIRRYKRRRNSHHASTPREVEVGT